MTQQHQILVVLAMYLAFEILLTLSYVRVDLSTSTVLQAVCHGWLNVFCWGKSLHSSHTQWSLLKVIFSLYSKFVQYSLPLFHWKDISTEEHPLTLLRSRGIQVSQYSQVTNHRVKVTLTNWAWQNHPVALTNYPPKIHPVVLTVNDN